MGQSQGRNSTQGSGRSFQVEKARLNLVTSIDSTPTPPLQVGRNHLPEHGRCFSSVAAAAATAKSRQSCPTLCASIDCSPPGAPVPGILQARTLEWVAMSFSSA